MSQNLSSAAVVIGALRIKAVERLCQNQWQFNTTKFGVNRHFYLTVTYYVTLDFSGYNTDYSSTVQFADARKVDQLMKST